MTDRLLSPDLFYESRFWHAGCQYVAGVDEAGRGALAGPVVAAAVIVPPGARLEGVWTEVRDSKQLSAQQRERLAGQIRACALAWGVGVVECTVIDAIGIAAAARQAMIDAVRPLCPDALLIDWVRLPTLNVHQQSLIKADATIVSVAAASILAKTCRDQLMIDLAQAQPAYGFESHKGYGTAAHLEAIRRCGSCPHHRLSFAPFNQHSLLDADES